MLVCLAAGFPKGSPRKLACLSCHLDGFCCHIAAWKDRRSLAANFRLCCDGLRAFGRQHVLCTFRDCVWRERHIFSVHHTESHSCHFRQYRWRCLLRCYHLLGPVWEIGQKWPELSGKRQLALGDGVMTAGDKGGYSFLEYARLSSVARTAWIDIKLPPRIDLAGWNSQHCYTILAPRLCCTLLCRGFLYLFSVAKVDIQLLARLRLGSASAVSHSMHCVSWLSFCPFGPNGSTH